MTIIEDLKSGYIQMEVILFFDNDNCNAGKFESLDDDVIGKLQENCVEYSEAEIYFAI